MQEKCFPETHDFKIFPGQHAPGPPLATKHLCCVGACTMMSEKVHCVTNATFPSKRLAASLFAAMLSVFTVDRVALAERLPPKNIAPRPEDLRATATGTATSPVGRRGSVVASATYKGQIAGLIPNGLNCAPTLCSYRQGTLPTRALSPPRSKWEPGRTVNACVFE